MQATSQRNLCSATRPQRTRRVRVTVVTLPALSLALTVTLTLPALRGRRSFFAAALRLPAAIVTRLMPRSSVALTFSVTRPPRRTLPTTRSFSEG